MNKKGIIKKIIITFVILISVFIIAPAYALLTKEQAINGQAAITVEEPTTAYLVYAVNNYWKQGNRYYYDITFTIQNTGTAPLYEWVVSFGVPNDIQITSVVNSAYTLSGTTLTMTNLADNGVILPGTSQQFRIVYTTTQPAALPEGATLNGEEIEMIVEDNSQEVLQYDTDLGITVVNIKKYGNIKYDIRVTITNNNPVAVNAWLVRITDPVDSTIKEINNCNYVDKINEIFLTNLPTNGTIQPNGRVVIDLTIETMDNNYVPTIFSATGKLVS